MSRVARLAAVALGLAAAVYGTASLTGRWLGTPPWWERVERREPLPPRLVGFHWDDDEYEFESDRAGNGLTEPPRRLRVERRERPIVAASVAATGLALVAFGAWPRRRRAGASP